MEKDTSFFAAAFYKVKILFLCPISIFSKPSSFPKTLLTAHVIQMLLLLVVVCAASSHQSLQPRGASGPSTCAILASITVILLRIQSENVTCPAALLSSRRWGIRKYLEESCKWLPQVSSAGAAGDHCECWFPFPAEIRGGLRKKQEIN